MLKQDGQMDFIKWPLTIVNDTFESVMLLNVAKFSTDSSTENDQRTEK